MRASEHDTRKSIITNFYEFVFNGSQTITNILQQTPEEAEPNEVCVLYGYKVTVHPKMEKSTFLKQREQLLFGFD